MGRGLGQARRLARNARLAMHRAAIVLLAFGLLAPVSARAGGNMPNARVGAAYSYDVDGVQPGNYSFATFGVFVGGNPPDIGNVPGLVIDSATGEIHGVPTTAGLYHVYYEFHNSSGDWGNEKWLTVDPPNITLSPATLAPGTINVAYHQAISAGGGIAPYAFTLSGGALPAGLSLLASGELQGTPTIGGTFNFSITVSDSSAGTGAPFSTTRNYVLVVDKNPQTISFGAQAARTYAPGASFVLDPLATSSSGLAVAYASQSLLVCTIAGDTVTILRAGSCIVAANQPGDAYYAAAPMVSQTIAIGAASQAITGFVANPAAPVFAPGGTFSVSATGGASTSPVVFASTTPATCTVSGSTVTMLAAGSCHLTADQAGDGNYNAAPQVALAVAIGAAPSVITGFVANPAAPVFAPGGTFSVSATGGASTSPVVFASTTPATCTVSGSTVTMLAAGSCHLTADQAGDGNYNAAPQVALAVAIGAAPSVITGFVANPAAPVFAPGGTFSVSATGGASTSPVVFASTTPATCTVSGSTVTMLAAGSCHLTADQAGDGNYDAAPQVALAVAISAASQAITNFAANPAAPVFAPDGTFSVSATGGASTSPVVFASTTPATCAVSGSTVTMLAAGRCTLTAEQAGDANYSSAAGAKLDIEIGAATPALSWSGPLEKIVGDAVFELPVPDSPSSGAFTYSSSAPGVATVNGRSVTILGPGVATLTATQAAAGDYLGATVSTTLSVSARPDPASDPVVVDGLQAQVDASLRFAATQQGNIRERLRQLRFGDGGNPSHNGLTLDFIGPTGRGVLLPMGNSAMSATSTWLPAGWGAWTAGSITIGQREGRRGGHGFDFRSDGISAGIDHRIGRWVLGLAAGAGWDDTDFADGRSTTGADQRSAAGYGLWRSERWFVEGMLGWGRLDFEIHRWSEVAGEMALAARTGDQVFGSLGVGYERRGEHGSLAGYGRYDGSHTALDAYRESGLGVYDLQYRRQGIESRALALGVEGSIHWRWNTRLVRPTWMLEYRESLGDGGQAKANYVLTPSASDYVLALRNYGDSGFIVGGGLEMTLGSRWRLAVSYRHEQAGPLQSNSVGVKLMLAP